MADKYIPQNIEPKWQKKWEETELYATREDLDKKKFYFLTMLPYPSGDLHIGHWYAMTPSDAAARYRRMKGYNVFFPIGFDAFGLPAENAAIERGIHPYKWTLSNIETMRRQLRSMGAMWAWDREAVTCDPEYYKWTQWFFLKLYDMGLAYRDYAAVDFCPKCNTVLAREQVWGEDRHCERCGTPVIKKDVEHWKFRITKYADELLDFSQIGWPERVRVMQTNWIGRSEGANVTFTIEGSPSPALRKRPALSEACPEPSRRVERGTGGEGIVVFTTRPDTLWGATAMVLAPEHPLVDKLTSDEHRAKVEAYKEQAARQSEIERTSTEKEKTGVFIGAYAINPVNGEHIPIWVADYVMMTYGTGAIMSVPGHDERDFQFSLKFGLPIIPVIDRTDGVAKSYAMKGTMKDGFAAALSQAGIPFEERDGSLYVTMTAEQTDLYTELARAHIRPGSWTEVVGARWAFVFEDGVMSFGTLAEEKALLERCQALEPAVRDKKTVMEMLWGVPFYRDVLFHTDYGAMINSGPFTGTPGDVAVKKVTEWLEEQGTGEFAVNYRLRDWLISRQRYWGAPIPMIHCPRCGIVPVPYEGLPVLLPEDAEFLPTGESPLKYHEGFRHTTCPRCGGPAERETDTMDTFMCSSWYHYAYVSPYWKKGQKLSPDDTPWDPEKGCYWLPVDQYTGGIEHATMHLLYTRFFTKSLRDFGLVDFDEPMLRLYNQGTILGEDGFKMSKSRGNVVSPDEVVAQYGADAVRAYLMFIGPWDEGGPWNSQGIEGIWRFLNQVWNVVLEEPKSSPLVADLQSATGDTPADFSPDRAERDLRRITHQTIRDVTERIESFRFNTMLSKLMEFNNYLAKAKETSVYGSAAWDEAIHTLILLLAPPCPHTAEELWTRIGGEYSVHQQTWPEWSEELAADEVITLVVQVNGKVRDRLEVPVGIGEERAKELALAGPGVQRHTAGKQIVKVIYVQGRLVNIVVK